MDSAVQPVDGNTARIMPRLSRALAVIPLVCGVFAATGVGVALPGALLPVLSLRWRLGDEQGGRLFLMAWIGSSLGALLVGRSLRKSLLIGSMAVAAGALGLAICPIWGAYLCIALYGMGLGLTMTSMSLICQRQSGGSGTELVRLNLLWAVGACACPSLTVRALRDGDIRPVLFGLACCFVLLMIWTVFQPDLPVEQGVKIFRPWQIFRSVPVGLILMTLLVPGIEASAGGWLTTLRQARRTWHRRSRRGAFMLLGGAAAEQAVLVGVPSLAQSRVDRSRQCCADGRPLPCCWLQAEALADPDCVVLPGVRDWAGVSSATGVGAAISAEQSDLFSCSGVGASSLPWLTGLVSAERHSLRVGLAVPMAATMLLAALSLALPLSRWSSEDRG